MQLSRPFFVAAVLAASCSSGPSSTPVSPGAPLPAAASFAGAWDIDYRVVECWSARPWHCPETGSIRQLTLRFEETASSIVGLALSPTGIAVPLSGTVTEEGALLSGVRPPADELMLQHEVRGMRLHVNPGRQLSGRFEWHTSNFHIPTILVVDVAATRSYRPLPAEGFGGDWAGSYVVRSCTVISGRGCGPLSPGNSEVFELSLTQTGNAVTGKLRLGATDVLDVTGTAAGDHLTLEGTLPAASGGRMTLVRWSARRNSLGQLAGSFAYSWEREGLGASSSVSDAEMWHVALRP